MNTFVHRMLGHHPMNEAEEGEDLPGADEVEQEEEAEEEDAEQPDESEEEEAEEDESDIVVILGDETISEPDPEEKSAPKWVRQLRKDHKEAQRRIKDLESKLSRPEESKPA